MMYSKSMNGQEEKIEVTRKNINDGFTQVENERFDMMKEFIMSNVVKKNKEVEFGGLHFDTHKSQLTGEVVVYYFITLIEVKGVKNRRNVYTTFRVELNNNELSFDSICTVLHS